MVESVLRKMRCTMRSSFEFSSAFTIEHKSFDGMIFHNRRSMHKIMRFRLYRCTTPTSMSDFETFFISTHTRFLSIMYFVHIIIIITSLNERQRRFIRDLRISYNLFF